MPRRRGAFSHQHVRQARDAYDLAQAIQVRSRLGRMPCRRQSRTYFSRVVCESCRSSRIGPFQFQKLDVHGDKPAQHDIMARQVEHDFVVGQLVPSGSCGFCIS